VLTLVVSDEHEDEPPEYQVIVYGAVPPDQDAVRVTDFPASMVGEVGVIEPGSRGGLTVTRTAGEAAPSCFVALSTRPAQ
jgi:hypothetical protein